MKLNWSLYLKAFIIEFLVKKLDLIKMDVFDNQYIIFELQIVYLYMI